MKYVGVRYANVKKNLTPSEDFGKVYFTSGRLKKEFKTNPENFTFRLVHTFENLESMWEWEKRIALRVYKRKDWANQGWASNYGDNPEIGNLISEGKRAIDKDGKTSTERGAEKLKEWIWTTEEGEQYRKNLSDMRKACWESYTEEERAAITDKRMLSMDFQAAAKKAHETLSQIGEDGLTGYQRNSKKAHETKLENGIYEQQGKTFSDWVYNTEEGAEYRRKASERAKEFKASLTEERKADILTKQLATKAANPEKQIAARESQRQWMLQEDENGVSNAQKSAEKAMKTKRETGVLKQAAAKRSEIFSKKLSEMGDEEFEEYCAKYGKAQVKSFTSRRNNYLNKIKSEVTNTL
jgi:hypothetical protein